MPSYLPPLNGISQSAALAEAAIAAPITRVMLQTLEVFHPSMAAPVRRVMDDSDFTATLEATAPRDPGAEVTFVRSRIKVTRPTESDDGASPEVKIQLDNVTGYVADALRLARESDDPAVRDAPWELIERIYASDEPSAPAIRPVFRIFLVKAELKGASAVFTAAYRDSSNTSVPTSTFTPERYPGLQE